MRFVYWIIGFLAFTAFCVLAAVAIASVIAWLCATVIGLLAEVVFIGIPAAFFLGLAHLCKNRKERE